MNKPNRFFLNRLNVFFFSFVSVIFVTLTMNDND